MREGRVLVPLRDLFEAVGAKVTWQETTRTVVATRGDRTVEIGIGSAVAKVNGRPIPVDVPAEIIGGKTMVPLRLAAEGLGADVFWDAATATVSVNTFRISTLKLFPGETNMRAPVAVAKNSQTGRLYLLLEDKTLGVVDSQTGDLIAHVSLGFEEFAKLPHMAGLAVDERTNTVYVATLDQGLAVVDGATNGVRKRIDANGPVAIDPTSGTIYAAGKDSLAVVDPVAGSVVARIPFSKKGVQTTNIALNSETGRVYVPDFWGPLQVVDVNSRTLVKTVKPPVTSPRRIAVDSSRNRVYLLGWDNVYCLDGETLEEVDRTVIPGRYQYHDVVVDAAPNVLYVVSDTSVWALDGENLEVMQELRPRFSLRGGSIIAFEPGSTLAFDETTRQLFVTTRTKDVVQVFDTADGALAEAGVWYVGSRPFDLAINPQTKRIYVADTGSDAVIVVDAETGQVTERVAVVGKPVAIAVNVQRNQVYLLAMGGLYFIDGATNSVTKKLAVPGEPHGLAVNEAADRIYVTADHPDDGSLFTIDAATQTQIQRIRADFPEDVAVNPTTGRIYLPQLEGGKVAPIITGFEVTPSGYRQTISGWANVGGRLGGGMLVFETDAAEPISDYRLPDYHYQAPLVVDEPRQQVIIALSTDINSIYALDESGHEPKARLRISGDLYKAAMSYSRSGIFQDMAIDSQKGTFYTTVQKEVLLGFDAATLEWTTCIDLAEGSRPEGVAVNPTDGRVYVANWGDGTLAVVEFR